MSDIAERLRYPQDATADHLEAATEIERLRARLAEAERLLRRCDDARAVLAACEGGIVTMSEHADESVNREINDYITKCRAMHRSHVAPVPRFAHAVSALADQRDTLLDRIARLEQAIWEACDSFRSLGCAADADDLERIVRASTDE